MARRRMMSLDIMDNPPFIDCSIEARYLYLEITVRADDSGFCNVTHRLLRMIGCSEASLAELIDCGLLLRFDSGLIVVRDWLLANRISDNRKVSTIYKEEERRLDIADDGRYSII